MKALKKHFYTLIKVFKKTYWLERAIKFVKNWTKLKKKSSRKLKKHVVIYSIVLVTKTLKFCKTIQILFRNNSQYHQLIILRFMKKIKTTWNHCIYKLTLKHKHSSSQNQMNRNFYWKAWTMILKKMKDLQKMKSHSNNLFHWLLLTVIRRTNLLQF